MRGARMLKIVSRSLSDVGRSPSQSGGLRRRPFSEPAITRMRGAGSLSDLDQLEAGFPALEQLVDRGRVGPGAFEPRGRFLPREVQEISIAHQIDESERRDAGLPGPEEVAGTSQL